ncbi:M16 family metallopeptidase [Amycolatopsis sp. lyj-23]|uniref:M16 family metallopeptidase n=1 Tax=Amycolatopsis sp. lyj-23 TaxID=2789283 RepID=UPI00397CD5B3
MFLVVGDLDFLDIESLASDAFGDLSSSSLDEPFTAPDPASEPSSRLVVATRAGAVQNNLRIGHDAPSRRLAALLNMDVIAINIGSAILGGTVSSRLSHELREAKGYTYGVHAGFDFGSPAGFFAVTSEVSTGATGDAIADVIRIIDDFVDSGVTRSELETTRAYLAGAMPVGLQTVSDVGGRLVEMTQHGLPTDYLTQEHATLLEVSLDHVNNAIRGALHPDRLIVVVEGDSSAIGADLAKLKL